METINGWTLTGNKKWTSGWEAVHACGYTSGFDSRPSFLRNTKKCRQCGGRTPEQKAFTQLYAVYRWHANNRNISFELSEDEFMELILQECRYCGETQKFKSLGEEFDFNGVDRVDNTKGYVAGNVVPCCRVCNVAKGSMTEEEFMNKIKTWHDRLMK